MIKFVAKLQQKPSMTVNTVIDRHITQHNLLSNRDLPDQHPISAITGLQEALDEIPADYVSDAELESALLEKQDVISDLAQIRSGALLGSTAVQPNELLSYVTEEYVDTELESKQDALTQTQMQAVNSGANTTNIGQISTNTADIADIDALIPNQASTSNQLADKDFVNSSIATNTANFIGTFNSVAELEAYSGTLTNNDYAFVSTTDTAGNTLYDRYKWNGSEWLFEYELNNSSFTAVQWAAINSGTTTAVVDLAQSALQPSDNISELTNDAGYVTRTDYPTTTKGGVVVKNNQYGIFVNENNGILSIIQSSEKEIDGKINQYRPVTPKNLDYAVKTGVTTNTIELTNDEKINACNWLGAIKNTDYATASVGGVVKVSGQGLAISPSTGIIRVDRANNAEIVAKNSATNPIVPQTLDTAVKVGVTTNTIALTDEEKAAALNWLGVPSSIATTDYVGNYTDFIIPDTTNMKVLKTYNYTINQNIYKTFATITNNIENIDLKFSALFRITVTGQEINSILECLVSFCGTPDSKPYIVCRHVLETYASNLSGIRYFRVITPRAYNNGADYLLDFCTYNGTERNIKIEVLKDDERINWQNTLIDSDTLYDSTKQNINVITVLTAKGIIASTPEVGITASTATMAGRISGYLNKTLSSQPQTGEAIAAQSIIFIGNNSFYSTKNKSVPINPDYGIQEMGGALNANVFPDYSYIRQKTSTNLASALSTNIESGIVRGDIIYLRCTMSNGQIYSDDYIGKTVTSGYTWYCLGIARDASVLNFDTTTSFFFTLDSNGKLSHINGREIKQANIATSVSSASTNDQTVGAKLFYDTIGDVETLINAL